MTRGNIKPHSPPLTIEVLFKNATVKSVQSQRVSTSTLRNLIQGIKNSSDELSLKGYEEVYEHVYFLNKTLENQESKRWLSKQGHIDRALDLAAGRLALEARKEIRNQHYGRDDILYPGEIITDKKVKHFREIKLLIDKVNDIEKKIKKFNQQQHRLRDSVGAIRKNFYQYKLLGLQLRDVIAEINRTYKDIDSSSYQHNKQKLNILDRLSFTTTDLHYALKKMVR